MFTRCDLLFRLDNALFRQVASIACVRWVGHIIGKWCISIYPNSFKVLLTVTIDNFSDIDVAILPLPE
jgi:hypothetical protein